LLLKLKQLQLLEADGDGKCKARADLTEEQKAELLKLDVSFFEVYGEHLITNYKTLK